MWKEPYSANPVGETRRTSATATAELAAERRKMTEERSHGKGVLLGHYLPPKGTVQRGLLGVPK